MIHIHGTFFTEQGQRKIEKFEIEQREREWGEGERERHPVVSPARGVDWNASTIQNPLRATYILMLSFKWDRRGSSVFQTYMEFWFALFFLFELWTKSFSIVVEEKWRFICSAKKWDKRGKEFLSEC